MSLFRRYEALFGSLSTSSPTLLKKQCLRHSYTGFSLQHAFGDKSSCVKKSSPKFSVFVMKCSELEKLLVWFSSCETQGVRNALLALLQQQHDINNKSYELQLQKGQLQKNEFVIFQNKSGIATNEYNSIRHISCTNYAWKIVYPSPFNLRCSPNDTVHYLQKMTMCFLRQTNSMWIV